MLVCENKRLFNINIDFEYNKNDINELSRRVK
jgi:hypothetical protein